MERRIFAAAIKYLGHVFMEHEIFLKIFDEPQKIFLCASFFNFF